MLDVLVQSRRDRHAAERVMRMLIKKHGRTPRVPITDKLKSYAAADKDQCLKFEHRQRKGLNNRAENSHQPTLVREKVLRRFKSPCQLQRFLSIHEQVGNLSGQCRYNRDAKEKRALRDQALADWERFTCAPMLGKQAS